MTKMTQTYVIQVDASSAMVKSVKDVLLKEGYDVKLMEASNAPVDASMDTLEAIRFIPRNYPKGCEIILIAMD